METFDKVRDVIVDSLKCEQDEVSIDTSLSEDLGVDSLDAIELIMALEDSFGISIPQEEAKDLKTVREIVELIDARK